MNKKSRPSEQYIQENREVIGKQIRTFREKKGCLLYTSDAADERSSVDLGGRRIIKKKNRKKQEKKMKKITH
mgnify:CR=1 FL=1